RAGARGEVQYVAHLFTEAPRAHVVNAGGTLCTATVCRTRAAAIDEALARDVSSTLLVYRRWFELTRTERDLEHPDICVRGLAGMRSLKCAIVGCQCPVGGRSI